MRKKSLISMCLAVTMLFAGGCGNVLPAGALDETAEREEVELIKSTVAMPDVVTERATYRDIYVTDIYDGCVYPEVKEYSFAAPQTFEAFGKLLGDQVVPGDVLVYADDEKLLEQIESYQERVDELKESYQEFVTENNEAVEEAKGWMKYYAKCLENMQEIKPVDTAAPDYARRYADWEKENKKWEGEYSIQEYNVMVGEEEMRQRTELYHLDYDYYNGKLQALLRQHKETKIVADVAGTVVAAKGGGYIAKGTPVIAVSCEGEKYIKTGYIYKGEIIYKTKEIYAFVNGKRYELTYLEEEDSTTTTFLVHDDANELKSGDFANIVLVKKGSRENALTVSSSAIYGVASERYVYRMNNNKVEKTMVKCGASDGIYTEILEGLQEGDMVQLPRALTEKPVSTTTIAVADKVTAGYSRNAEIRHVESTEIKNTLKGVTVFFVEYLVEKGSFIQEGTPMVRVRVEGDPYVVEELEREIKRDLERLDDKIAAKPAGMDEKATKAFDEAIAATREKIADKEERLAELKEAYSTTTFNAPVDGYVSELQWFPGETLLSDNQSLAIILPMSEIYLVVDDSTDRLQYGQNVSVAYNRTTYFNAKVANIGNYALSEGLKNQDMDYLVFYNEQDMLEFLQGYYHAYAEGFKLKLQTMAEIVLMKNTLTVPEKAVIRKDGATYVKVVLEDGSVELKSFLGTRYKGKGDYWVIDGLTEGMTICLE